MPLSAQPAKELGMVRVIEVILVHPIAVVEVKFPAVRCSERSSSPWDDFTRAGIVRCFLSPAARKDPAGRLHSFRYHRFRPLYSWHRPLADKGVEGAPGAPRGAFSIVFFHGVPDLLVVMCARKV